MSEELAQAMQEDLTLLPDPEGDNDMSPATESPQAEEDADAMFPEANDNALNSQSTLADRRAAAGELSPPRSQDAPDTNEDEAMDLTSGEQAWETSGHFALTSNNGNGTREYTFKSGEQWRPGAWDTVKAREEYHRHWTGLVDKNFSLSEETPSPIFIATTTDHYFQRDLGNFSMMTSQREGRRHEMVSLEANGVNPSQFCLLISEVIIFVAQTEQDLALRCIVPLSPS